MHTHDASALPGVMHSRNQPHSVGPRSKEGTHKDEQPAALAACDEQLRMHAEMLRRRRCPSHQHGGGIQRTG